MDSAEAAQIRGTETILIAEDDEPLRVLISSILKEFGYNVIASSDGDEAVQSFMKDRDSIDLAVLDMMMPGKNGKEVFDIISRTRPDLKCILASGYTSDIFPDSGSIDNRPDFIMKPFPPLSLVRKIRNMLDS